VTNRQFKKFVDANPQWFKGRIGHSSAVLVLLAADERELDERPGVW